MLTPRKSKTIDGVQYNECTKCGEWLEATEENFYKFTLDKNYGLQTACKKCTLELAKVYRENNKEKLKIRKQIYHKNNKEKVNKKCRDYWHENKEKMKEYKEKYYEANREKILESHGKNPVSFKAWEYRLTVEESPKEDKDGKLMVKCAYCGRYFYPNARDVAHRIIALSSDNGSENRLYCSDGCKKACPIFRRQKYPKGYKKASSREVDPLIRQMCLERDEYKCQICWKTIEEIELHAHHIEGTIQQPMLANDIENVITLCKKHHKKVHSQEGCTYYDLRCDKK